MAWVKAQNARTLPILERDPSYPRLYAEAEAIAQSKGRIAYPAFRGGQIYNFWQDAKHVHGIWRRTTQADYAAKSPHWTTVLDLDALAKHEGKNWVWKGADCNRPRERYCMLSLSAGGEDAVSEREFDLNARRFVPHGFDLPRAKQTAAWIDDNALLVARPWARGEVTTSGYPYDVRLLRRGRPLASARRVFRGRRSDVAVDPETLVDGSGHRATLIDRGVTFFTHDYYLLTRKGVEKLSVPPKSALQGLVDDRLIWTLNENWLVDGKHFEQGSLVAISLPAASAHPRHLKPVLVYAPGPRESIGGVMMSRSAILASIYRNVRGRALVFTPSHHAWRARELPLPDNSSIDLVTAQTTGSRAYVAVTGFLAPTTLWSLDTASGTTHVVKAMPAEFDASRDVVEQHEATSKDGTKIPYFIVRPKAMKYDGANPTVLYAYGGFQISETPFYSGTIGKLWLERGGVFVLANIRGGGEFGPAWHEAAIKTHRQRAYDDFYAVAQDVIARRITTPRYLGIQGGSNGGLLMGVEFTQHPSEWNAVDIQVPLLDMLRYQYIDAGASWVGEYGSVNVPAQRAFLAKISPYNNLRGGVAYPEPFIWTTTKDDRVGPQHARKFAAKLAAMGVPYLFYEVTAGGHGAGANLKEAAHTASLEWTYFTMKLMER